MAAAVWPPLEGALAAALAAASAAASALAVGAASLAWVQAVLVVVVVASRAWLPAPA